MKVFDFMEKRGYISAVLDNRHNADGLITVTLKEGYFYKAAPDADTQSFETLRLACAGCSKNNVFNPEEDAKKAEQKAKKTKVPKMPKAHTAPKAEKVVQKVQKVPTAAKAPRVLSDNPEAVAKREKRAKQKAQAAAIVAEALVA